MTLPRVSRLLLIKPASLARTSTAPDLQYRQTLMCHKDWSSDVQDCILERRILWQLAVWDVSCMHALGVQTIDRTLCLL